MLNITGHHSPIAVSSVSMHINTARLVDLDVLCWEMCMGTQTESMAVLYVCTYIYVMYNTLIGLHATS